jgi:hypothetical protein
MILKLFKKDQPILWLVWPIIVVLFWIPSFIAESIEINKTAFTGAINYLLAPLTSTKWAAILCTLIIVIIQSFYIKYITSKHDLIKSNTFFVPFMYCLTLSIFQLDIILNPFLFTASLLLIAVNKLLDLGKEGKSKFIAFEASLIIGLAAILYYPIFYFIPLIWIALFLFKSFNIKEWTHPIVGIIVTLIYLFAYWFWNDNFQSEIVNLGNSLIHLSFFQQQEVSMSANISRLWIAITIGISANSYFSNLRSNVMRKKYSHLFFVWLIFICLLTSVFSALNLTSFFICASVLATLFYSVYAVNASKKLIPELIAWTGILLVIANFFYK